MCIVFPGLAVDISAADLQYSLQGIPELGQLQVQKSGDCRGYSWYIQWLTIPGNQPLLKARKSSASVKGKKEFRALLQ